MCYDSGQLWLQPPSSLPPSLPPPHSLSSTPSQHNQAFIVICIWTNRCSRLCLCLHISHERFALFFPPHPSSKTPTHNTYALNSAEGFIVTASVLPVHGGHVCDSLVNKKKKTLKPKARAARSDETQPEGDTWEYTGYNCPSVTDRISYWIHYWDHMWQNTPVTVVMAAVLIISIIVAPDGISEPTSPAERQ